MRPHLDRTKALVQHSGTVLFVIYARRNVRQGIALAGALAASGQGKGLACVGGGTS